MIELSGSDYIGRPSSRGNQLKFKRDGYWYKMDYLGYEGLAEFTVSELLRFSDLSPDEYVRYRPEQMVYNGNVFNGCCSRDFTDGWQLITLERLFEQAYGAGTGQIIHAISDHAERLKTLVDRTIRITGLNAFGIYISKMLAIDAFFLNEDRHLHNIGVLTNARKEFRLAPFFDHGSSLLSDTTLDYPLNQDTRMLICKARPKTFCDAFDEQLDIAEQLYGVQIHFRFSCRDVANLIHSANVYSTEIQNRVIDLIMQQRKRYPYLFDD